MKIGLCGAGRMGTAAAHRLVECGHAVSVWNRTRARAAPLLSAGIGWAVTPAELVRSADAVIVFLSDDAALEAVYEGDDGLLSADLDGQLIIEMSTVRPETNRRLAEKVEARGAVFVECPVGGTVGPAREGRLLGLAGGRAEAFEKARPLLEQMCRRVELVGPAGAGAAMKLAVNLPLVVYWEALGEALAIADAYGIDRDLAGSLLGDSSGAASVAKPRIPGIVEVWNGTEPGAGAFSLATIAKDSGLMVELARERGFSVPVAEAAHASYEEASADGWSDHDGLLIAAWRAGRGRTGG